MSICRPLLLLTCIIVSIRTSTTLPTLISLTYFYHYIRQCTHSFERESARRVCLKAASKQNGGRTLGGDMYSGSGGRPRMSSMTTVGDGCISNTDCLLMSALSSSSLLPPHYCSSLSLGSLRGTLLPPPFEAYPT